MEATAFCAASSRSCAVMKPKSLSSNILRPTSTLVPAKSKKYETNWKKASFDAHAYTVKRDYQSKEKRCYVQPEVVPSTRTMSGTLMFASCAPWITPFAMVSQRMIPPKMLTMIAFTCMNQLPWDLGCEYKTQANVGRTLGSPVRIVNAVETCSAEAPPPTSKKLAGSPP